MLALLLNVEGVEFQSTHPARGATESWAELDAEAQEFQSTHPARGATSGNTGTLKA